MFPVFNKPSNSSHHITCAEWKHPTKRDQHTAFAGKLFGSSLQQCSRRGWQSMPPVWQVRALSLQRTGYSLHRQTQQGQCKFPLLETDKTLQCFLRRPLALISIVSRLEKVLMQLKANQSWLMDSCLANKSFLQSLNALRYIKFVLPSGFLQQTTLNLLYLFNLRPLSFQK